MDSYRQDSAYTGTSGLPPDSFRKLTSDETATYRRWRGAVVGFYCSLLILGGFSILMSIPVAHREMAQVMPAVNVP